MKITIPAFIPMAKCNEHLAHGPIEIDLGEDIVPVVRCKKCKWTIPNGESFICTKAGYLPEKYVQPDDYCSKGERKSTQ